MLIFNRSLSCGSEALLVVNPIYIYINIYFFFIYIYIYRREKKGLYWKYFVKNRYYHIEKKFTLLKWKWSIIHHGKNFNCVMISLSHLIDSRMIENSIPNLWVSEIEIMSLNQVQCMNSISKCKLLPLFCHLINVISTAI